MLRGRPSLAHSKELLRRCLYAQQDFKINAAREVFIEGNVGFDGESFGQHVETLYPEEELMWRNRYRVPNGGRRRYADMPVPTPDPLLEAARVDFPHPAYAIDDPSAYEIDDAVSITTDTDGREWLHIHASDAARWLPPQANLHFPDAQLQGRTLYFPDGVSPMLGDAVTHRASLKHGVPAPGLTFSVRLNTHTWDLEEIAVHITHLADVRQVQKAQVEAVLQEQGWESASPRAVDGGRTEAPEDFTEEDRYRMGRLMWWADRRRQHRLGQNAVMIPPDDRGQLVVDVDAREIHFDPGYQTSNPAATSLVEELMLLAGRVAAYYCASQGIPVPFRHDSLVQTVAYRNTGGKSNFQQRDVKRAALLKATSKAGYCVLAQPHRTAGLKAYLQVTSPIRRWNDLVSQYQIKRQVAGQPTLSEEAVLRLLVGINRAGDREKFLSRQATKFWTLAGLRRRIVAEGSVEATGVVLEVVHENNDNPEVLEPRTPDSPWAVLLLVKPYMLTDCVHVENPPQVGDTVSLLINEAHIHSLRIRMTLLPTKQETND